MELEKLFLSCPPDTQRAMISVVSAFFQSSVEDQKILLDSLRVLIEPSTVAHNKNVAIVTINNIVSSFIDEDEINEEAELKETFHSNDHNRYYEPDEPNSWAEFEEFEQ